MRRAGSPAMQGWPRGGRGRSRAAAMVIGAAAGGGEEQLRFVRPAAFQHAGVGGGDRGEVGGAYDVVGLLRDGLARRRPGRW